MPPKLSDLKQPPLYYSLMVLGWWGPGGVSRAGIPRWWRVQSLGLPPRASGVDPDCWLGSHLRPSADHQYVASVCSLGFPTAWHLPVPSEPRGETACLSTSWSQKSQSHPHSHRSFKGGAQRPLLRNSFKTYTTGYEKKSLNQYSLPSSGWSWWRSKDFK